MRGDLAAREPQIIEAWEKSKLYQRTQEVRADKPKFVLHDGPPYSNGNIHYGHILNKILKDLVVKSRSMSGFRTPYVPGWDTHGLPIELAVERKLGAKRKDMSAAEVRAECKKYALEYVNIQRTEFKRLGVLGDWEHPYLTLDASYEGAIARALAKFARGGYLYRGKKPVLWCPRDRTALAEAEIEYKDKTSPSVYVRMPLVDDDWRGKLDPRLEGKRVSLVIWTTTPWTLPSNLAIVAHPQFTYVALPHPRDANEYLVVAKELAETFVKAIGGAPESLSQGIDITPQQMAALERARYVHPFVKQALPGEGFTDAERANAFRLYFADYVTADAGTGLVHTAPGHGADDFKTGMKVGLPAFAPLDDSARYVAGITLETTGDPARHVDLSGKATTDANPIIVQHLADTGFLLNPTTDSVGHSYPHCWRCKGPIVFRATPQWFIEMDHAEFRTKALAEIRETDWIPAWGEERIYAMIENRPDWVLSRQRLWGTPIPTFYCKACNAPHASADTIDHVAAIFDKEGADAWWTRDVVDLIPAGTKCDKCGASPDQFEREKDIVDVWFESGVSWLAMAARDRDGADYQHIDMYLEGSDQHRGWFHSSLLAAVGVQGKAPYDSVITHGFVLDENGIPYSKSSIEKAKAEGKKTSYIEPDSVIKKSGAEMFRLWVASTEYRTDITYSQKILDGLSEWYRRFRNTARFLLGNLNGFTPAAALDRSAVTSGMDRYMLARLDTFVAATRAAYDAYEFHTVHRLMVELVSELSAVYSDVTKDVLYCDAEASPRRRVIQAVQYECLRAIVTLGAPIMVFTCEDVWSYMPRRAGDLDSVHLAEFPAVVEDAATAATAKQFETVLAWREKVTQALEPFRAQKKKSVDAAITLRADAASKAALSQFADELADVFIVSSVTLADGDGTVEVADHTGPRCERCRKHFDKLAADPADACDRCAAALAARSSAAQESQGKS